MHVLSVLSQDATFKITAHQHTFQTCLLSSGFQVPKVTVTLCLGGGGSDPCPAEDKTETQRWERARPHCPALAEQVLMLTLSPPPFGSLLGIGCWVVNASPRCGVTVRTSQPHGPLSFCGTAWDVVSGERLALPVPVDGLVGRHQTVKQYAQLCSVNSLGDLAAACTSECR